MAGNFSATGSRPTHTGAPAASIRARSRSAALIAPGVCGAVFAEALPAALTELLFEAFIAFEV
jgi:hypothetical protein